MQKSRWTSSLKIAKKAKDKSIYNFIQWRHITINAKEIKLLFMIIKFL